MTSIRNDLISFNFFIITVGASETLATFFILQDINLLHDIINRQRHYSFVYLTSQDTLFLFQNDIFQ